MPFDIDVLRAFVLHCPASPPIRRLRLSLFDRYRYEEDYEAIYQFITDLGGIIE
jgi:hypothetical protein